MGRRISFFRSAEIETRLLNEARRIGLSVFPLDPSEPFQYHLRNLTALGYKAPTAPSAWNDGEYIEYGYFPEGFSARLWFDPVRLSGTLKPKRICAAYEKLIKFVKRDAVYDREGRLWVSSEFRKEYEDREAQKQRELRVFFQRNRAIAARWSAGAEYDHGDDGL